MKKILIIFLIPVFTSLTALGQSDSEALKILEKFSSIASAAPSVSMKFKLITEDQAENRKDTLAGDLILKKDNYRLSLPNNTVWYNSETSWSYLPAENEVTISKPDKNDNSFQNKPSLIFSMYKSGYKCRLVEERSDSYIIDLYPVDIKSDMVRARLVIGKSRTDLKSLEYKKRDGIVVTLQVTDYNLTVKAVTDTFTFIKDKYKGVDVIDIR